MTELEPVYLCSHVPINGTLFSPSSSYEFFKVSLHTKSRLFLMTINNSSAAEFLLREPFVVLRELGL